MRFGDLISDKSIDLQLPATSKEEAIRTLVSRVAATHGRLDISHAVDAVLEREYALSTGVGQGVAVPHATLHELEIPLVGFGRCDEGIEFGSMDGRPVTLLFLLLAPEKEISLHLKLLSRVSRLCNNPGLREALHLAPTPHNVLELIREHESLYREL